jgi:hypothetical protein
VYGHLTRGYCCGRGCRHVRCASCLFGSLQIGCVLFEFNSFPGRKVYAVFVNKFDFSGTRLDLVLVQNVVHSAFWFHCGTEI